jgi:TonB family protein
MIRISRWAAPVTVLALAGMFGTPAYAQYANEYTPPKLAHQGTTGKPIAGTGTVIVQVQVNGDGSHRAIKVIKSTNSGDNAAALEIAQRSTYHPARRGKRPITAFYDYTLKFTGKSVAAARSAGLSFSGASAAIDQLIKSGNYAGAKARAQAALQSKPGDPTITAQLGAAEYFLNDPVSAAATFAKVSSLSPVFKLVASNSYMQAASHLASSDPQLAMAYARKAVALTPNAGGAYYALGAAELASGDAAQAATDLKKARDIVFADPKTDAKSRVNVDAELYSAYTKAGDTAQAQATMAEIRQIDPNNTAVATLQANSYITQGQALQKAGKYDEAIAAYLQAAAVNNPDAQVTGYLSAAFALSAKLAQPSAKPTPANFKTMQGYADKAMAIRPADPQVNYAEGIALAGQYLTGGKTDASLKTQAMAALNKAKSEAQASGNMSLSLSIDNFVKTNLPQ